MSRYGGPRGSGEDLAYGEVPQRWDRGRFERFGGQAPPTQFQEDYRFRERDGPGRRDIQVTDRIDERGPGGAYEERDRFTERDRYASGYTPGGRKKRSDRELFGDQDPREIAEMALTPYRKQSASRNDFDIDQRSPPSRPGLMRRQSSLDTFDRRPIPRYTREERPIPVYTQVPMPPPVRTEQPWGREGDFEEDVRFREYDRPDHYREVEIHRESSTHRRAPKSAKSVKSAKSSRTKSRRSSSSSSSSESFEKVERDESVRGSRRGGSVHESFHESYHGGGQSVHESFQESVHGGASSVSESIQQTDKKFKKGKTRMPKRLVRREAVMDLGYPFDEEEAFFVLRIALEKEQIDEIIRISETYKNGEKKTVYKYDENVNESFSPQREHEEVLRTEWINPPTVVGGHSHRSKSRSDHHSRQSSHSDDASTIRNAQSSHRSRSHRRSEANRDFYEDRKTVIEERSPPPRPPTIYPPPPEFYEKRETSVEERDNFSPSHYSSHQIRSPSQHQGTMVLQEREYRSDRDINTEIAKLEAERRALRLEREAEERRNMAVRIRERPEEDFQLVEYREQRPTREVVEFVDRDREKSPDRNVLRVEKDRKERRKAKIVAAAMATLT